MIGLQPMLRSVFIVAAPDHRDTAGLPLTCHAGGEFYIKPEGCQFLCSPSDETPHESTGVRPEELEIARAIDAINEATTLGIRSVRARWAGLRSFLSDRNPVAGYEPDQPGLFWFAGQGGAGIEKAPAFARLPQRSSRARPCPPTSLPRGSTARVMSPGRATLHAARAG